MVLANICLTDRCQAHSVHGQEPLAIPQYRLRTDSPLCMHAPTAPGVIPLSVMMLRKRQLPPAVNWNGATFAPLSAALKTTHGLMLCCLSSPVSSGSYSSDQTGSEEF